MAGYGGLGGLGGYAFPTRRAMGASPNSAVVQSDPEFEQSWADKLATVDQYQTVGGARMDTGTPWWQQGVSRNLSDGTQSNFEGVMSAEQLANSYGLTGVRGADGQVQYGTAADLQPQYAPTQQVINPEWQKLKDQWTSATAQRGENQTRQQQAYDTAFSGNGAIGGVMPKNYGDANFGQITGQKQGGLGGLGGADLTAVDQTQQTGAYMGGSGAYNPNPFSPGSFKSQNPWSGF